MSSPIPVLIISSISTGLCITFAVILLIGIIKKRHTLKACSFLFGGMVIFIAIPAVLVMPGSEYKLKFSEIEFFFKSPSIFAKLVGENENEFRTENTDKIKPQKLVLSASSDAPVTPSINIMIGAGYIEKVKEGEENTIWYYITLPPGGAVSGTTSPKTSLTPLPLTILPQ